MERQLLYLPTVSDLCGRSLTPLPAPTKQGRPLHPPPPLLCTHLSRSVRRLSGVVNSSLKLVSCGSAVSSRATASRAASPVSLLHEAASIPRSLAAVT